MPNQRCASWGVGAHSAHSGRDQPSLTASCEHALTTLPCLSSVRGPTTSRPSFFCGWQCCSSLQSPCSWPLVSSCGRSWEVQGQKRKEELGKGKRFFLKSFFSLFLLETLGHELCLKVAVAFSKNTLKSKLVGITLLRIAPVKQQPCEPGDKSWSKAHSHDEVKYGKNLQRRKQRQWRRH